MYCKKILRIDICKLISCEVNNLKTFKYMNGTRSKLVWKPGLCKEFDSNFHALDYRRWSINYLTCVESKTVEELVLKWLMRSHQAFTPISEYLQQLSLIHRSDHKKSLHNLPLLINLMCFLAISNLMIFSHFSNFDYFVFFFFSFWNSLPCKFFSAPN